MTENVFFFFFFFFFRLCAMYVFYHLHVYVCLSFRANLMLCINYCIKDSLEIQHSKLENSRRGPFMRDNGRCDILHAA